MNINKSVTGVISILIIVLLASTVAIPIIENASNEVTTTENNPTTKYMMVDGNSSSGGVLKYLPDQNLEFAGEKFETGPQRYILSENIFILLDKNNVYIYDKSNSIYTLTNKESDNIIAFENGIYTYSIAGQTYTGTYSTLLYPSSNGNYGSYGTDVNIDRGDKFYMVSTGGGDIPKWVGSGVSGDPTITDLYAATIGSEMKPYEGSVTAKFTQTESDDKLSYKYSEFKLTCTPTVGIASYQPLFIIAPLEYHIISESDSAIKSLMGIIPIMLLIIPVFVAVSAMRGRSE